MSVFFAERVGLGDKAQVTVIAHSFVILNLFQDDEPWGEGVGSTAISGITHLSP
jgi:hypothetical protein